MIHISVPVGQRKQNSFTLHIYAVEEASHTLRITSNTRVFKPLVSSKLIDRICELAVSIPENIERANNITLNSSKTNFNTRRKYQNRAYEQTRSIISDIKIAIKAYKIKKKKASNWLRQYETISYQILKWMDSDNKRFSEKVEESKNKNNIEAQKISNNKLDKNSSKLNKILTDESNDAINSSIIWNTSDEGSEFPL